MTITITPLRRALVPIDSQAAQRVSAPNYDEFQSDQEIWQLLQAQPECVLGITMPHCRAPSPAELLVEGSAEALARASEGMAALRASPLTHEVRDVFWIYEIQSPKRPDVRQIGLGALARIDEIRTPDNAEGTIIRNEGVREKKARGRADLIRATEAFIGVVNNAIDDDTGEVAATLTGYADARDPDLTAGDQHGNQHRVWLVSERAVQQRLQDLFASEPCAYVADGNHRSAAAALLGSGEFSAVFFPARTMGLAPYNRLVDAERLPRDKLLRALDPAFEVKELAATPAFQPMRTHEIGLYTCYEDSGFGDTGRKDKGVWYRLVPRPEAYDPRDAVQDIDAEIVQRLLFDTVFGIRDATDERLNFVGGDREASYLQQRVDRGEFAYAITLPPVTMEQFVAVCRQNRIMPPKSTWFEPKVRSGLVIALR